MNYVYGIWAAAALVFLLFFLSYKYNKMRLSTGFAFLGAVFLMLLGLGVWMLLSGYAILQLLLLAAGLLLGLMLLFGVYVLIVLLLLNTRAVFKRERHSLGNSLTLLLALGLIALQVVFFLLESNKIPFWLTALEVGFMTVLAYYFVHVVTFLTTLWLCNLARPRKKQEYIIVLGSGLVNGKVPPLLAGRIDRAIAFYHKQKARRTPPKLLFSGGQGFDEPVAEGEAMRRYALEKGIPEENILVESRSANTRENMAFSKKLLEEDAGKENPPCVFSTSNYHLLRAGVYARRAGMRIDGIGAKTAFYYLPNAVLREYLAFLRLYLKRNLIIAGSLFTITAAGMFLLLYISNVLTVPT